MAQVRSRRRGQNPGREGAKLIRGLALLGAVTVLLRLFLQSGAAQRLEDRLDPGGRRLLSAALVMQLGVPLPTPEAPPEEREMPTVIISSPALKEENTPPPPEPPPQEVAEPEAPQIYDPAALPALVYDPALIAVTDHTSLNVSPGDYLSREYSPTLSEKGPSVLIVHTHGSEAYTPTRENNYTPSDPDRTEDKNYNMIRVGDLVESILTDAGIGVVHNRELHDYPSYNGSYTRSLGAIEEALDEYPEISVVLDLHRDSAQNADGSAHKTTVTLDGVSCAQVMLVVGTGEGGLPHPDWEENFRFALELQTVMQNRYPGLARGIDLRTERFNQHATPGSLIVEVGYSGNTLEEALAAAERFAACLAEVLTAEK